MKIRLFVLLLLGSLSGMSQEVEFGSESESKSYRNMPFILGKVDGKLYTVRFTGYSGSVYMQLMKNDSKAAAAAFLVGVSKFSEDAPFMEQRLYFSQNSKLFLEIYDEQLQQISSRQIDPKLDPKADELLIVQFAMVGKSIFAFAYDEEKKGPGNKLMAYRVSEDGKLNPSGMQVAEYNTENNNVRGKKSHTFRVYSSPAGTKAMIVHSFLRKPKDAGEKKYIHIGFLDENMNLSGEKEFDIASSAEGMELVKAGVSEQGDAAFLVKYKNPESKGPEDLYETYTYISKTGKFSRFELGLDGYYTNDILFDFQGNQLIISGFYSGRSKSSAEGYFYSLVDLNTGEEVSGARENFTDDFMQLALGKEKAEDAEYLSNMHMRNVIRMPDGGITLVAEQYYIVYLNNGLTFNYGNMFMLRCDAQGNMVQQAMVPKKQRTGDDGGLFNSFCVIKNADALHFIYNANKDKPAERMSNTNKASVYMTTIPFSGEKQTTRTLFNGKEAETVAVPKIFLQESESSVVFYNYKHFNFKFARVKF